MIWMNGNYRPVSEVSHMNEFGDPRIPLGMMHEGIPLIVHILESEENDEPDI